MMLLAGTLAVGAVVTTLPSPAQPATAPTSQPATTTTPDGFEPITYFNQSCARCHGRFGKGYGAAFAKGKGDDALRQVVKEMAEGPGGAPLEDAALEVETAYHRSLRDGVPFVAVTRREGAVIAGEVTPGATLVATRADGSEVPVAVSDDFRWELTGAADVHLLTATVGERSTTLDLFRAAHSSPAAATP